MMVLFVTVVTTAWLEDMPLSVQLWAVNLFSLIAVWRWLELTWLGKTEEALPGPVQMHGQQVLANIPSGNSTDLRIPSGS